MHNPPRILDTSDAEEQRPPNLPDVPAQVETTQGSGGDPTPAGALAQTSRTTGERVFVQQGCSDREPDSPTWRRQSLDSLGGYQTRYRLPRRLSSGYYSNEGDSLPGSPLSPTADRATQTPSPSAQAIRHALQSMEAHGGAGTRNQQQQQRQWHGNSAGPFSRRTPNAAGAMPTEAIGKELQRIGDDFNILMMQRLLDRNRPDEGHIRQEPAMMLSLGLLLLVIGRIILQGNMNSQNNSQV